MKKKIIYGLLILAMFALPLFGACTETAPTTTPAPAVTETPAAAPADEVINLKFAIPIPDLPGCNSAKYFLDFVEEKSAGRVKFERFWGGVLGAPPEMLDMVSSGSVDFTCLMTVFFKDRLPLHNFPEMQTGGPEKAMSYLNELNFEIPETAALLEAEYTENNLKALKCQYVGENGMIATTVFETLADLKGKKVASMKAQPALTQLGFNVVSVTDADTYEALSRGVADCASYGIGTAGSHKWYEVTKCYMFDGICYGGWQETLNLDTWNSLPADIQKIFLDAADATETYSIECNQAQTEEYIQTFKDAGLVVGQLPESDTEQLLKLSRELDAQNIQEIANNAGKGKEMEIILKYAEELTWGK